MRGRIDLYTAMVIGSGLSWLIVLAYISTAYIYDCTLISKSLHLLLLILRIFGSHSVSRNGVVLERREQVVFLSFFNEASLFRESRTPEVSGRVLH
jgi:hypothetical protein